MMIDNHFVTPALYLAITASKQTANKKIKCQSNQTKYRSLKAEADIDGSQVCAAKSLLSHKQAHTPVKLKKAVQCSYGWLINVCTHTLHIMLRYSNYSANSSLAITLLVQKYHFLPVKWCYLCHFFSDKLKKWEQIMCLCTKDCRGH